MQLGYGLGWPELVTRSSEILSSPGTSERVMGSIQLPVLWVPGLFPGKAVVACIEFENEWSFTSTFLRIVYGTAVTFQIRERCRKRQWKIGVTLPDYTSPQPRRRQYDWVVCLCSGRHNVRFSSVTPYAVSACEVQLALHSDIARCRARCVTGPALCCSSFFTLIGYCNSLQVHTFRIALQQRYMEHYLQAEFCRQHADMHRFSA